MSRQRLLRSFAVIALLTAFLLSTQHTFAAWSYWTYGAGTDVPVNNSWTYYGTARYVASYPSGIWFSKEDGLGLQARWITCGSQGASGGPTLNVSNSDPAPGVFLKENGSSPATLTFCLGFRNNSGSGADTFTGSLNWDD